ncbi:dihydrolipoyl dehydrogenase family protein [Sinorhizobium americanum]|uniref:Pyruvate/2-oxoglutarate dehydrogenase complex dihydrolipoamide dehydrogenase (E3) component n=1 Tax=Sinorhizobium americanum TaxID=194963 RepID=A0A4R2C8H4_9HYPH|nr:FAD-dependent oxidoreductase [Sinorhizobium americanum]TCN36263.1 pyruvate/2-oxoglutarate dehydrogenase complex dihydrolipoamide dehydrogenase (E3) component [Sinorhizobium americanum]
MGKTLNPDICVIGGGAAGLSLAAGAAAFGVPTVLVERGKMGGDCLNYGCVPSKALIAAARRAQAMRQASEFGLVAAEPFIDGERLQARIRSVIDGIAPHDSVERFAGLGVKVIQESARFVDDRTVAAGDHLIRARRFVIATGSSPAIPPIAGLAETPYLTNESLFDVTPLPPHLVIIGAGPFGLEMAQAHCRLGARVTIVESAGALSKEDPELKAIVLDAVRAEGTALHERTDIRSVERDGDGMRLHCVGENAAFDIDGSDLLLATGRTANHAALNLGAAGIRHDAQRIFVGADLRTSNRRVYVIGDAAGGLQFTHAANYHARLVLQQILFRLPTREIRDIVPRVTFTDPEIAQVGPTEEEARASFGAIDVVRWDLAGNDRSRTDGLGRGMVKVVVGRGGRILGAGIAGAGAGEMINLWAFAIANRLTLKNFRDYVAPYPTLSEIGKQAAISYYSPMAQNRFVRSAIRMLRRFG